MEKYDIANRIYELRKEKGLSQRELGDLLGVSNKSVSKWETGSALPKTQTLVSLAEIFGISSEELLQGTTNDRRTLGKLSAEVNQHFLQEELARRNDNERSKEARARKKYIAVCITVFVTVFAILTALTASDIIFIESESTQFTIFSNILSAYWVCSLITGVILMIKTIQQFDVWKTVIACILFPLTLIVFVIMGFIMVIPEIIKSIKIIREDKNGHIEGK